MRRAARLLPLAAASLATLVATAAPALASTDPACAPASATRGLMAARAAQPAEVVPGEVVVRYRSGAAVKQGVRRLAAAGVRGRQVSRKVAVVKVPRGQAPRTAAAQLERDPDVLWAEPNYLYRALGTPDDALFAQQWALHNTGTYGRADADIDAPEAWATTTGSAGVLVGVIDTGADLSHPDLAPNIARNPGESGGGRERNGIDDDGNGLVDDVRGWDFAAGDPDPSDTMGHGTHVTGSLGARGNDGRGIAGVAWNVSLLPLRALNDDGWGSSLDIADAMTYAARRGARVVNVSLGGTGYSHAMLDAICGAPDTLFVVAAGNSGKDVEREPFYPCSFPVANVLCVAATDSRDALASFSNRGRQSVDIAAPGAQILSTVPGGGHAYYSGTSMATPHVAGAAALLFAQRPEWTPGQVKEALLATADRLPSLAGAVQTGGRLNVGAAVALAAGPAAPAATTRAPGDVTATAATLSATVDAPAGGSVRFEYGTGPELGSATAAQAVAPGTGTVVAQPLAGLQPATTYHVRAVLATPEGEVAGGVVTFTTAGTGVAAATSSALPAGKKAARLRGTIRAAVPVSYRFEYGPTRRYGRVTPLRRLTPGSSATTVEAMATRLVPGRRYHYRLVVVGPAGTVRGADRTIVVGRAALAVRRVTARGRQVRVTVRVPGPGRVTVLATRAAGGRAVTLGKKTVRLRAGGARTFTVRLAREVRRLKAAGRVEVTVTFTPAGGSAAAGRSVRL